MRFIRPALIRIALAFSALIIFSLSGFAQSAPPRITQRIDETKLATLKGNMPAVVRVAADRGKVADGLALERLQLVLQRSPQQEAALRMLLDQQQDKSSPNYHKWLTPEQFGKQFGPADADVQAVVGWLEAKGFRVTNVTKGRTAIEFSGDAGLVRKAFHTEIHQFLVNGKTHIANSSDLQIPAALSRVVVGIASLHDFFPQPQYVRKDTSATLVHNTDEPIRHITLSDGTHALGPDDYATIYNIAPLYATNVNGAGKTIAVLGVTDIVNSDVSDFDTLFGLPGNNFSVVHNGSDPGIVDSGDQFESTLDNEWAGATGRGAQIKFVVSGSTATEFGTDLSAQYVIENNLADVMTVSYGACEVQFSAAGAQFEESIAEQAAAQGITFTASTGDAGAEGCDSPNFETVAAGPITVNIPASTPFTVAVGGTEFNEGTGTFWSGTNSGTGESALSYIPEDTWNDSCAQGQGGCVDPNIAAGGGGVSQFFAVPTWQQGIGVPLGPNNQPGRGLPDVSLTAALVEAPYFICFEHSCQSAQNPGITLVGGTSASTPTFAGIMSLVDQGTNSRQGQADYVLYKLAATETLSSCNASSQAGLPAGNCIFNDVTVGSNTVSGETGFGNANSAYQSAVGWDAASGLGSVNVNNLVTQWNSVSFNSTTTKLQISASSVEPNQSITAQINVTSGSGTPAGDVSVVATADDGSALGLGSTPLSNGSASISFSLVATQNYNLSAHYAGNGTFGASDSAADTVAVESFTAAANPTQQAIAVGAAASSTVTVTGANFTGDIKLTCVVSGTKPTDAEIPTCSFNSSGSSATISLSAPDTESGTATLNVTTIAKSTVHYVPWNFPKTPGWIAAAAAATMVFIFLLVMPDRKRRWRAAFALMAFAAMAGLAGCSNSGGNPGTTPDTYTVAVMASSGGTTQPATFTVTVQ